MARRSLDPNPLVDCGAHRDLSPKKNTSRQATWSDAQALCKARGEALPIIQTPRHNEDLRNLISGPGPTAWLGLSDRNGTAVRIDGGGWQWVDGNSAGRPPANITTALRKREPIGALVEGEVTYFPGYHNWEGGAPSYGTRGCATLDAASGRWAGRPCAEEHAVVCCAPPADDQFSCSKGVTDDSKDWPLVPFYLHDDPRTDDVPKNVEDVGRGFRTDNAYFIGNAALSNLRLDEAELCLEDEAADKRLCAPLYPLTLTLDADTEEHLATTMGLNGTRVTALHKMVAILSGQIPAVVVRVGMFSLGEHVGRFEPGNAKLCLEPPGPFGTPLHCWQTCRGELPCGLLDGATPEVFGTSSFANVPILQWGQNWAVGVGPALDIASTTNELHYPPNAAGKYLVVNGAKMPWTTVYVRARGKPERPSVPGSSAAATQPACPPNHACNTSALDVVCYGNLQMRRVPRMANPLVKTITLTYGGLTAVGRNPQSQQDFAGLGSLTTLDISSNQIEVIDEHAVRDCGSLTMLILDHNWLTSVPAALLFGQ